MTAPATLKAPARLAPVDRLAAVPAELLTLNRWVLWRKATRPNGKAAKIPLDPTTGGASAADKDPTLWRSLHATLAAGQALKAKGIAVTGAGFCFKAGDNITGIDLDDVLRGGRLDAAAAALIARLGPTYCEISPSGRGLKLWVRGTIPQALAGPLGRGRIEVYSADRFFTVTGAVYNGAPSALANAQAVLDDLVTTYGRVSPIGDTPRPLAAPRPAGDVASLQAEADKLLALLRQRIDDAQRGQVRAQLATVNADLTRAVRDWFNDTHPIGELLEYYGATRQGARDYSCPFEQHSHPITYRVDPELNRARSFSTWGALAHDRGQGISPLDVYMLGEGLTVREALERAKAQAIGERAGFANATPAAPVRSVTPEPVTPQPSAEQLQLRAAEAERKRQARRAEATAIRASVEGAAASDETLTECAQITLLAVIDACGPERVCCRWSNARLAEHSGFSVAYIRKGLAELEAGGYIRSDHHVNAAGVKWAGGRGTVWRTLLRCYDKTARSTEYKSKELPVTCEGGVASSAPEPEPQALAIEDGAAFDPQAAALGDDAYTGRLRRHMGMEQALHNLGRYYALAARPAVVELPPELEAEQHALAEVTPAAPPKKRRKSAKAPRFETIGELTVKIIKAERRAAKATSGAQRRAILASVEAYKAKCERLQLELDAEHERQAEEAREAEMGEACAPSQVTGDLSTGGFTTFTTAAQPPAPLEGDGTPSDIPPLCHVTANVTHRAADVTPVTDFVTDRAPFVTDATPNATAHGGLDATPTDPYTATQYADFAQRSRTMADRFRQRLAANA